MIDKPAGPTSHDVVAMARRALGTRAIGHAGTLDPFATGLLILLVGGATRLARFVERHRKGYHAEAVLGVVTDTDDRTGRVVEERTPPSWPSREEVATALAGLTGSYPQRPPAYSARRVAGRRGYQLARAGRAVELPPTEVTVTRIELLGYAPPTVRFRAEVSAGTYIRSLVRDLGERLGTGAHATALRREWIGPFRVEEAVSPLSVTRDTVLLSPLALVTGLPARELDHDEVRAVRHGRIIPPGAAEGNEAALVAEGRLVAVAERVSAGWHPRVVLEPA